jgi:malonate decarboxylase gamma subunit
MAGKTGAECAAHERPLPVRTGCRRELNNEAVRFIAVVPDANNHYPRAAKGEVGLLEGWTLAKVVNETIAADANSDVKRPIVAVIDVPSQAYGRREEAFGIHQALAGAAGAYAKRLAGHPVIGLIVGKAMSGAFLAHGYQANRLIAINDKGVLVHAMGKASAARITLRTVEALEKLAATIPPWPTTSATTPRSACSPTCSISAIRMPRLMLTWRWWR